MSNTNQSRLIVLAAVFGIVAVASAEPPHASSTAAHAPAGHGGAPHWTYSGEGGPEEWGRLASDFATCAVGHHQSPIDLAAAAPAAAGALRTEFPAATLAIASAAHLGEAVHNGHTIQVDFPKGDTLSIGGVPFELAQFHFHAPSEHTVAGQHFPVEIHFVHKSAAGKLAVIGVLVKEGAANSAFASIESALPKSAGGKARLDKVALGVGALLPTNHALERYAGSLTTPPCSEQVSWFVLTTPIELSAAQIATLSAALTANSRPVQPVNGRDVVSDELTVH